MPGSRSFETQLAAVEAVRDGEPRAAADPLRRALANRNNYVVGKAADVAQVFGLRELTPELLAAFDRFFADPEKTDPQCWAKNAIARALAAFELQEPEVFLRGMHHHQYEPVWGGRSDTAGTLRGTCALALVQCRSLSDTALLTHLVDLLADGDKYVRTEAVRAMEQVGSPAAALLLRLRAILPGEEPEVLGACYGAILRVEGHSAGQSTIRWVSRFLAPADDAAAEAALAIAGTHSVEAFEVLRDAIGAPFGASLRASVDSWFRSVLFSAVALTRQEPAYEFLLDLIERRSRGAEDALEALLRALPPEEVLGRAQHAIAGDERLMEVFRAQGGIPSTRQSP